MSVVAIGSILIIGGGGHGRVVADIIRALGGTVAGFADREAGLLGAAVDQAGGTVVIDQASLRRALTTGGRLPNGAQHLALGVGSSHARLELLRDLGANRFATLMHPSCVVSPTASIGRGTVLVPGSVINAAASIGDGVIINTAATVGHDCEIGDGVHVAPGANICGGSRVGRGAWVGAGSVVIQGISIGEGAMIGAGSVIIQDVPPGAKVVGNPGRVLGQLRQ